jgi:osmotically-inducible protein OsmY
MHRVTIIIFSIVFIIGLALPMWPRAIASADGVAGYAKDVGAAMTDERVRQFTFVQEGSNEPSPSAILGGGVNGVVILDIDDLQAGWLENVAASVVQVNIDENVDLFLNVIPWQIGSASVLAPKLQEWNTSRQGLIEMGQHGFKHEDNLDQLSYADQRTIVEEGLAELNAIGINPKTFTPGNGNQNMDTLGVLGDLGFHTDLDCWEGLSSTPEILVLRQCACELSDTYGDSGPGVNFKSSSTLMSDIDSTISSYGYAIVAFHMQDFSTTRGALDSSKLDQYRQILRDLKNSGKYQFMTPEEYYQTQSTPPVATVSSVIPSQGAQGKTLTVIISGSNLTEATAISFGSGITVNNFIVNSDSQITVNISIASDAILGPRDASLTTPRGTGTLTGGFTVTQGPPTIYSVSPSKGAQGKTLTVITSGSNFTGSTAISFGSGITVNNFIVNSDSQITVNISIASDAALGPSNVSVTTPGGTGTLTGGFTVTQGPPTIYAVIPSQGAQGKTLTITISGSNFIGSKVISFGSGITINSLAVSRSTRITANIAIGVAANLGPRDVSVTTAEGTGTLTGGFTVTQAPPTIYSVVPSQGSRGQTLIVIITGSNLTGATAVAFGSKIAVNSFTVNSDTQIVANITIATKANQGTRDVKVTTQGGTATLRGGFTVK